jgi:hypothetical protein
VCYEWYLPVDSGEWWINRPPSSRPWWSQVGLWPPHG